MSAPGSGRLAAPAAGLVLAVVAALVAVFAGRGDDPGPEAATLSADRTARTVAVTLLDMRISPGTITVPAGTRLTLAVTNADSVRHDLRIDGGPTTPLLGHHQRAVLHLGVVRRTVQGWCTVPGHRAAGMTMTIRVAGTAPAAGTTRMAMPPEHGSSPAIDFQAAPGPGWRPHDPALPPAPGSRVHRATFTVRDTSLEVAPGVRQTLWTYNGTAPGPILHGRVGDRFEITIVNHGTMKHGIDFHAGAVAPDGPMRSLAPGRSLTYRFTATYSGAWLYHCSTMPMSLHIANGMYGAVIIDPPDLDPVAREFVLVQSELYLGAPNGVADDKKIDAGRPDARVFNGYVNQYDHAPLRVRVGGRVRIWVVDAGPQYPTSFHVVGTAFDTVFKEGAYLLRPGNREHGAAQTLDLAPAQGGFVEFTLPAAGHYPFVDHAMVDAEHGAHGVLEATR